MKGLSYLNYKKLVSGFRVLRGLNYQKKFSPRLPHGTVPVRVPDVYRFAVSTSVPTGSILKPKFFLIIFPVDTPLSAYACSCSYRVQRLRRQWTDRLCTRPVPLCTPSTHIIANLVPVKSLALLMD